jgi:hypothetical protein
VSYQRGRVRVIRRKIRRKEPRHNEVIGRVYVVQVWTKGKGWADILDRWNFLPARAIAMALSRIIGGERYQTKVEGGA